MLSGIHMGEWGVHGLYMPDGTIVINVDGQDYLVTANEGDATELEKDDGTVVFTEEIRGADLKGMDSHIDYSTCLTF